MAYNALPAVYEEVRPALVEVLGDEIRDVTRYGAIVDAVAARDTETAHRVAQAVIDRGTDALNTVIALVDEEGGHDRSRWRRRITTPSPPRRTIT